MSDSATPWTAAHQAFLSFPYTFNRWTAREYVTDNKDLLREALQEFCTDAQTIGEKFLDEEWEYFDVTIRCYLLYNMISEVLDEMEV